MITATQSADALDLVKLTPLMERSSGRPEVLIGLIDGPVAMSHLELNVNNIREVSGTIPGACSRASSVACTHGTFVAGILCGKRGSAAPSVAPNCTLLVRPIFSETTTDQAEMPSATPEELARAIIESIDAGAHVLNLSAALTHQSPRRESSVEQALDYAARRGVLVVAASGNHGTVGSSAITRHQWVLPVISCDRQGRPTPESNLGGSIGKNGLGAPGEGVTSLGADGEPQTFDGTSAAAPFVTGTIALLLSEFPTASAAEVKLAIAGRGRESRACIVPPLLDAWSAYQALAVNRGGRQVP
jgi:subtilisin family serine protease